MSDFTRSRVTKGRLTDYLTGTFREFSLNPSEIQDTRGVTFASSPVPGISHPASQGGSGSERSITFTLRLDGEVGYRDRRRIRAVNNALNEAGGASRESEIPLDISDELNWYRHFTYAEGNATLGSPRSMFPLVIFTFGTFYQGVLCELRQCDISILQLTPRLEPMRADVAITLVEKVFFTVSRSSVWDPNVNRNF